MKNKFSFTIILFVIGIALAVIISVRAVKEAYRNRKIEKEVESLRQEAERIQNDNDTLQKQIDYYSTSEFVEKISKDKMNLQKPGETVVIVKKGINNQSEIEDEKKEIVQVEDNEKNYKKWWDFFFKFTQ